MTETEIADMKSALEKAQASIKALEETNKQLKAEKTEAKRLADEAERERDEAASTAAAKAGDVETVKAQLQRKHEAELKKLNDQLNTVNGELSTLKIDNVIAGEIAARGVLPHNVDILSTYLKSGVKMEGGEALKDGVPLADSLKTWFSSDAAKHYVAAPANSGAGAQGSASTAAATSYTKENFTLTEHSKLAKEKGAAFADNIARSVGVSWAPPE